MVRIASIFFDDVRADRELFGGYYRIPAVPKGDGPVIIEVVDLKQYYQGTYQDGGGVRRPTKTALVRAEDIARDIVNEWTVNGHVMSPTCHPGIWVVRETIPLLKPDGTPQFDADNKPMFRPATEEERKAMWLEDLQANREADANYAEALILEADSLYSLPNTKARQFILPRHKKAARQYGRERDWLKDLKSVDMTNCPYCKALVETSAIKCRVCGEVIDAVAYAERKAREAAAVPDAKPVPVRPPAGKPQPQHAA